MWAIDNQTPFAAERTFVRDRDGSEIWLVAVRASFKIQPDGQLAIADKQEPVVQAPQYLGKPGKSSLRCDSDLPRTKLGTDVLLNAKAYAPPGRERNEIEVGFQVGDLKKTLLVSGERKWQRTLGVSVPGEPQPLSSMPITYERSFGGPVKENTPKSLYAFSDSNPIGVGIDTSDGAPLPNIRYPGTRADAPSPNKPPAGFGAISSAWSSRRLLAGTYDDKWQRERQPLLPDDFRDEFFYSAPEDQRVAGFLRGGEKVALVNLTPNGYVAFNLPKITFGFRTSIDGGITNHRSDLHCVLIEPDHQRLIMVWHSALPCHHTLYTLKRTVVFEKKERETLVA
ncbi:MAG: DUF2169 domain-containing protein [Pirellula sp.]